jgi:DNA-directed RNA polymerase I, II, and III subunit RPABC2
MNNLQIQKLDSDIIPFTNNNEVHEKLNDKKISQPYLTKYEYAKIIGIAAQQIESGRKPLVKPPASYIHPIEIAEYELKQKKTPIIIKRKLPNDICEYFTLDQLII